MKRFLLLRDNQEKGPYSLEELKELGIKSDDLVWVEGKSIAWGYPVHIEELKGHMESSGSLPAVDPFGDPAGTAKPPEESFFRSNALSRVNGLPNTAESFHNFHYEEPDQEPNAPEQIIRSTGNVGKHSGAGFLTGYGGWIVALLVLLAGTTWVLKKAVDVFNGNGFSHSKMTHAATPLKTLPEGQSPQKDEDATYQNAISREIVPVDTSQVKTPVKKKPRLKELKKYLRVESNDYKVGVFGGINNLQLTVFNNSSYELDKVVLQVDYLKPKGESLQTEKYTFFSIPSHGKKTLDIPPTKRGVKVKYKIVDAKSRDYKVALVQA